MKKPTKNAAYLIIEYTPRDGMEAEKKHRRNHSYKITFRLRKYNETKPTITRNMAWANHEYGKIVCLCMRVDLSALQILGAPTHFQKV